MKNILREMRQASRDYKPGPVTWQMVVGQIFIAAVVYWAVQVWRH